MIILHNSKKEAIQRCMPPFFSVGQLSTGVGYYNDRRDQDDYLVLGVGFGKIGEWRLNDPSVCFNPATERCQWSYPLI